MFCDATEAHYQGGVEAEQQLSFYKLTKPYQLIGRWRCCPECFQNVMAELKQRVGGVAVVWPLKRIK